MTAKEGDKVKVEYTGALDDGTVFDSSHDHGKLLEFEIGKGHVIRGFDNAIVGMSEGEEKEFIIHPPDAYGDYDPSLVQKVPRDIFPKEVELSPGLLFEAGLPTGEKVPARVKSVEAGMVAVDLNHPLAGKTLNFKIKLKEIATP